MKLIQLILLVFSLPLFAAGTEILTGEQVWLIILTPRHGNFTEPYIMPAYKNDSLQQRLLQSDHKRIVIERRINFSKFDSKTLLSEVKDYKDDPKFKRSSYIEYPGSEKLQQLADKLSEGKIKQVEYVDEVMFYVRDRLIWENAGIYSAEGSMLTGHTTCAGFANLAVALLRTKGIPARMQHVEVLTANFGSHAEVEVYYKDKGWVSYDPQATLHHVGYNSILLSFRDYANTGISDQKMRKSYEFFRDKQNRYNIEYKLIKDSKRKIGEFKKPLKYERKMRAREDGYITPSQGGKK